MAKFLGRKVEMIALANNDDVNDSFDCVGSDQVDSIHFKFEIIQIFQLTNNSIMM